MTLVMSILVRDECDVIESNIRFHALQGVDRFIVTDNGSIDGTRERLQVLAGEFDIELIDEPSRTIDQDLWVTRMAERVRQRGDAQWLIHNDADEFWRPRRGCLKSALQADLDGAPERTIGVLLVPRCNLLFSREQALTGDMPFDAACHRVERTWRPGGDAHAWHDIDAHILVRTLPGKVITRLDGLLSIDMGNHGARHAGAQADSTHIEIFHYPIRSYAQFQSKVRNYGESLAANDRFGPRVSRHLRYWYERHLDGTLQAEFASMHPDSDELDRLLDEGLVVKDERLRGRLVAPTPRTDERDDAA